MLQSSSADLENEILQFQVLDIWLCLENSSDTALQLLLFGLAILTQSPSVFFVPGPIVNVRVQ